MENNNKFKTREEIAGDFGISVKTMCRKLKAAGIIIPPDRYLSPAQYKPIYEFFQSATKLV